MEESRSLYLKGLRDKRTTTKKKASREHAPKPERATIPHNMSQADLSYSFDVFFLFIYKRARLRRTYTLSLADENRSSLVAVRHSTELCSLLLVYLLKTSQFPNTTSARTLLRSSLRSSFSRKKWCWGVQKTNRMASCFMVELLSWTAWSEKQTQRRSGQPPWQAPPRCSVCDDVRNRRNNFCFQVFILSFPPSLSVFAPIFSLQAHLWLLQPLLTKSAARV